MYGQNHSQGGCVAVREGCLYRILREHPLVIVLGERNSSNVKLRKDQDSKRLVVLPVLTGMYIYIQLYTWRSKRKIVLGFDPRWKGTTLYIEYNLIQKCIYLYICIYLFLFAAKMCMNIMSNPYRMSFHMNVMHESHSMYAHMRVHAYKLYLVMYLCFRCINGYKCLIKMLINNVYLKQIFDICILCFDRFI